VFSKKIVVEDYSPSWALTFQTLKSVYALHLGNLIVDIQHVGSTSVEGLAAKPVIDIDIIIDTPTHLPAIIQKLKLMGYEHRGNLGITDREAFKGKTDQVPFDGSRRTWPKHHLYVCPADSISLKNHLALRDFLRSNPNKAQQYGELKKQLATEHPYNMDLYIARKTPFITAILQAAGFDDATLHHITQENKLPK
jgi:GrpB-like predicted nucleotidyltransferase (UPF0157 family)